MCLAIPGLVIELPESSTDGELPWAVVEFAGARRRVCVACLPDCQPGDYLLVHAGIAISRIDPHEARRVFAHLQAAGEDDGWNQSGDGQREGPAP